MSSPKTYEIRADFDRETLVVYQAYIHAFCRAGEYDKAKKLLPSERVYPLPEAIAKRLGMG